MEKGKYNKLISFVLTLAVIIGSVAFSGPSDVYAADTYTVNFYNYDGQLISTAAIATASNISSVTLIGGNINPNNYSWYVSKASIDYNNLTKYDLGTKHALNSTIDLVKLTTHSVIFIDGVAGTTDTVIVNHKATLSKDCTSINGSYTASTYFSGKEWRLSDQTVPYTSTDAVMTDLKLVRIATCEAWFYEKNAANGTYDLVAFGNIVSGTSINQINDSNITITSASIGASVKNYTWYVSSSATDFNDPTIFSSTASIDGHVEFIKYVEHKSYVVRYTKVNTEEELIKILVRNAGVMSEGGLDKDPTNLTSAAYALIVYSTQKGVDSNNVPLYTHYYLQCSLSGNSYLKAKQLGDAYDPDASTFVMDLDSVPLIKMVAENSKDFSNEGNSYMLIDSGTYKADDSGKFPTSASFYRFRTSANSYQWGKQYVRGVIEKNKVRFNQYLKYYPVGYFVKESQNSESNVSMALKYLNQARSIISGSSNDTYSGRLGFSISFDSTKHARIFYDQTGYTYPLYIQSWEHPHSPAQRGIKKTYYRGEKFTLYLRFLSNVSGVGSVFYAQRFANGTNFNIEGNVEPKFEESTYIDDGYGFTFYVGELVEAPTLNSKSDWDGIKTVGDTANVQAQATVTVNRGNTLVINGTVHNKGTICVSGGTLLVKDLLYTNIDVTGNWGNIQVKNNGTVIVFSGGAIVSENASSSLYVSSGSVVYNEGLVVMPNVYVDDSSSIYNINDFRQGYVNANYSSLLHDAFVKGSTDSAISFYIKSSGSAYSGSRYWTPTVN